MSLEKFDLDLISTMNRPSNAPHVQHRDNHNTCARSLLYLNKAVQF
jgi:hypothetical protein